MAASGSAWFSSAGFRSATGNHLNTSGELKINDNALAALLAIRRSPPGSVLCAKDFGSE
jgi:hypothetical protein